MLSIPPFNLLVMFSAKILGWQFYIIFFGLIFLIHLNNLSNLLYNKIESNFNIFFALNF